MASVATLFIWHWLDLSKKYGTGFNNTARIPSYLPIFRADVFHRICAAGRPLFFRLSIRPTLEAPGKEPRALFPQDVATEGN